MSTKLEIIAEPGKTSIVTRRVVAAPRALVFDAFTKPEHLKRWLGPRCMTFVSCDSDLRVGGRWRFVHRAPDGRELAFFGEFREIVRPERLVRTFVFEPFPEDEALETLLLEERDGKTTVTTTTQHKTVAGRDGHLADGRMEAGMTEGYERVDELLAGLAEKAVIDTPRILETTEQSTAVIHITVARNAIRRVMGPGYEELMTTLGAQGIVPAGRWFTHHLRFSPDAFDFEIGVPVTAPVAAAGRVTNGRLPAATVARTIYHGPYEGLPEAWKELDAWIVAQGHTPATWLWETYLSEGRTELTRPLR